MEEHICGNCGVTPSELLCRQEKRCYLVVKIIDGVCYLFCTDGEDEARTDELANPTVECSRCLAKFTLEAFVGNLVDEEPRT